MKTILVDDELLSMQQFEIECKDIENIEIVGKFSSSTDALEYARSNRVDFALLDIDMPVMNGLELGRRLREIYSDIIIIFVTAYSEFTLDALRQRADYVVLKPYSAEDVSDAIARATLLSKRQKKRIELKMFGRFDVFCDGRPVSFSNAKAKELLALCADRAGGIVTMEQAVDKLWENHRYDSAVKALYRKAVISLRFVLDSLGAGDILVNRRAACALDTGKVSCDYFEFLDGKRGDFNGEYLFEYSWAESRCAQLMETCGMLE